MFVLSVAAEALSAVPHCWDGHRVGMEGVSILSDKVSILSSEWQNLSLFLGNIGDYNTEDIFEIFYYFIYWYCCDMLFTHNSSASLMRVYWKPFLILSPGARCQCRGSLGAPVPVADCHWSQRPLMAMTLRRRGEPGSWGFWSLCARVVFAILQ